MHFIKIKCNCEGSKSNYTCNYNHIITRILKGICACVINKYKQKIVAVTFMNRLMLCDVILVLRI